MKTILWMTVASSLLHALQALHTTESGDVRLVGGTSHCTGRLEVKHQGQWRTVYPRWNQKKSSVACRELGCGSVVWTERRSVSKRQPTWWIRSDCVGFESSLKECGEIVSYTSSGSLELICSESVRLVNGSGWCSGIVEVKSDQSWLSVCEGDFDQQDAEVVCRELGCGAPSVLQGALYGEVKTPMWTKEFQCEGNKSVLPDCRTSDSTRNTCSPDKIVRLTCSEPDDVRLVGGTSHCTGRLEMKHLGEWRTVDHENWNQQSSSVVCRQLGCGSVGPTERRHGSTAQPAWLIIFDCVGSESSLRECGLMVSQNSYSSLELICSESVRLVNGSGWCSGIVEVKSDQSWLSVCEGDFDQQDAEVVCRELGCGAPSVLQGALYGELKVPMWTKEFQCEGNESVLLDCRTSDPTRNTCSPNKTVRLTCSEPDDVRLVGGASHCTGRLEMKYLGEWRTVEWTDDWNQMKSSVVCRQLGCGSHVSTVQRSGSTEQPAWTITSNCVGSASSLKECGVTEPWPSIFSLELICSEPPEKPSVSVDPPGEVVEGSNVTLTCSSDANRRGDIYTWYRDTRYISTGPQLVKDNVTPADSGEYVCQRTHRHVSQRSPPLSLNVQYDPKNMLLAEGPPGDVVKGRKERK